MISVAFEKREIVESETELSDNINLRRSFSERIFIWKNLLLLNQFGEVKWGSQYRNFIYIFVGNSSSKSLRRGRKMIKVKIKKTVEGILITFFGLSIMVVFTIKKKVEKRVEIY